MHSSSLRRIFPTKIRLIFVFCLAFSVSLPSLARSQEDSGGLIADRVMAVVGREVFTLHDVRMWVFEARMRRPELSAMADQEVQAVILPDIVDDYLLSEWAVLEVEEPPAETVQTRAQADIRRLEETARGTDQLNDMLRAERIDPEEFRIWLKDRARRDMLIRDAISIYANLEGRDPFDATVENAVRLRLAHILVAPDGVGEEGLEAAYRKALALRRNIEAGLPFSEAARLYSNDPLSREIGGLLGWFTEEQIDEALWQAAKEAGEGATSAPVMTKSGYHLVTVLDFETEDQREYARLMRREEERQLYRLRQELTIILPDGVELDPIDPPKNLPDISETDDDGT